MCRLLEANSGGTCAASPYLGVTRRKQACRSPSTLPQAGSQDQLKLRPP